jgi:hypothetical protein
MGGLRRNKNFPGMVFGIMKLLAKYAGGKKKKKQYSPKLSDNLETFHLKVS